MSLIRVEHVDKSFASRHGSMTIMQDISFEVTDADFLAIVGPSGCGKSTLLRLIQGLDQPSAGHIYFRDQPVAGVCSQMAMVFQSFALYPWLTVAQNVAFGLEAVGWAPDRIAAQVDRYVGVTGLDGFQEAYPRELSGGMRQRVGLARALAVEPAVLLVTHNIEEAIQLADRVVVMSRRPSHLLEEVVVNLPRPRDRKTEAFYALTDRIFSLITEGGSPAPTPPGAKQGS